MFMYRGYIGMVYESMLKGTMFGELLYDLLFLFYQLHVIVPHMSDTRGRVQSICMIIFLTNRIKQCYDLAN